MQHIETVIVGGGQAGLATSYYLTEAGREHVVLEQADRAASAWRNGRWDSFTLVTPNWTVQMPGATYAGPDRDGYMSRAELVAYFERYIDQFRVPVEYNTRVLAIEPREHGGYRVRTTRYTFEADHVVLATGLEQRPRIPALAGGFAPAITQLHSSAYRNPGALPDGAVLVVGSAQSGCQIAEELYQSGRRVYLATSGAGRAPRRYRGKDMFEWMIAVGFFDMTLDTLPGPREHFAAPHVSGKNGGHTLNLHQFARDGVTLLGHLRGAAGTIAQFAPDLAANLGRADGFEQQVRRMVDGYIQAHGLDAPPEELPQLRDGYAQPVIEALDLADAGITSIVWATGYSSDFSLVKLPLCDAGGFPIQTRGVSPHTGLYFVGMPFMPALKTGLLAGVGESARHVAATIVERRAGTAAIA